MKPSINTCVAKRFIELKQFGDRTGAVFELEPYPDHLSGYALDEDGVTSLVKTWDWESDVLKHVDDGANLYLKAKVLRELMSALQC